MAQARNWCATINNWTEEDVTALKTLPAAYVIWGRETGAEGTPHLQIYIQFRKRLRMTAIKKLLPRAHLEVALGSADQNIEYCSKGGEVETIGEPKRMGERTDLDKVRRDAAENGLRHVTR